jgi:hypothetical protein
MKTKYALKTLWFLSVILVFLLAKQLPPFLTGIISIILVLLPFYAPYMRKMSPDEREFRIITHSSHVAYFVTVVLLILIIILEFLSRNREVPTYLIMLLLVPVMIKMLFQLYREYNPLLITRLWIGIIIFALFLFGLLSHGFSFQALMELIPALILLLAFILSYYYPKLSAGLLAVISVLFLFFLMSRFKDLYVAILMIALLAVPLLAGSYMLFRIKEIAHDESEEML